MIDNFAIPQKTTAPVVAKVSTSLPQQVNLTALQQAVEEAVEAALEGATPIIYVAGHNTDIHFHFTVHVHAE